MRAVRQLPAAVAAATVLVFLPTPAGAFHEVRITTPYTGVAVEAGDTVTFDLRVTAPAERRVDLEVTKVPPDWRATLRGGGFVVDSVFAGTKNPPDLELEVQVPAEAKRGSYRVEVTASSEGDSDVLPLDLRVARAVAGGVTLATEFPSLRGAAEATFSWDVALANNTPERTSFNLEIAGPEGWTLTAQPAGEQQAATLNVEAGSTGSIAVTADPPDEVEAGTYPLLLGATGGGQGAEIELEVEVTGTFAMTLTTPDERLNAEAVAGRATRVPLLILNEGSSPLVGVTLTGTPPADWEVTFEPEVVEQVLPGESAQVVAIITPTGEAVAGDYVVTISAAVAEATSDVELRTTVKTSSLWGIVGILLILGAIGGLGWVFRRYGRR